MHQQSRTLTEICFKLLRVQESCDDELSGTFFVPDDDLLVRKHADVLDAASLRDGDNIRMLHLVQTDSGRPHIQLPPLWAAVDETGTLYAPFSHTRTMNDNIRILLPELMSSSFNGEEAHNENDGHGMEVDHVVNITAIAHANDLGCIDLIDNSNVSHRFQFALKPINVYVHKILDALRCGLAGLAGEAVQYTWWRMCQVRQRHSLQAECEALVVTLFFLALSSSYGKDVL